VHQADAEADARGDKPKRHGVLRECRAEKRKRHGTPKIDRRDGEKDHLRERETADEAGAREGIGGPGKESGRNGECDESWPELPGLDGAGMGVSGEA